MATPHNAAIANCAANGPRAVFHAQAGDRYKTGLQISACLYCALLAPCEAIKDRTYITVYENKVEYNQPIACCCCYMSDVTGVVYFDTSLRQATKAGFCLPMCTHNQCFPTCCDMCGEGVVLHGRTFLDTKNVLLPGVGGGCCPCTNWVMVLGFDNASEIASQINAARKAYMSNAKGGAAPPSQGMSRGGSQVHPQ